MKKQFLAYTEQVKAIFTAKIGHTANLDNTRTWRFCLEQSTPTVFLAVFDDPTERVEIHFQDNEVLVCFIKDIISEELGIQIETRVTTVSYSSPPGVPRGELLNPTINGEKTTCCPRSKLYLFKGIYFIVE